jgi:hypothetical protein
MKQVLHALYNIVRMNVYYELLCAGDLRILSIYL